MAEHGNTEEMCAVADHVHRVQIMLHRNHCKVVDLLFGIDRGSFCDDVISGNPVRKQVIATRRAFRVAGVLRGATAQRDDDRGQATLVERQGLIEPRVKHGRWTTGVLCGPKNGDGISRKRIIHSRHVADLVRKPEEPADGKHQKQRKKPHPQAHKPLPEPGDHLFA